MEAAIALDPQRQPPARFGFLAKLAAAALVAAPADLLIFQIGLSGATSGLFGLTLVLATVAVRPDLRRRRDALAAAAAALLFSLMMIEDPGLLAFLLGWSALSLAALLPRTQAFGSGLHWIFRLVINSFALPAGPVRDARRLLRVRRRQGSFSLSTQLPILILPLIGSILFLLLFARANPLIGDAFGRIDLGDLFGGANFLRLLLWLSVLAAASSLLRPRLRLRGSGYRETIEPLPIPGVSTASVTLSLIAFNAIFALQNGLDLAFLWSGAPLPDGMTLAEYAHRGAYPLIGTALLAGAFVLVALRPGTDMAASRPVRRLVYLWIAQNVFLVASTMLRTIDYVQAYSLTELRIEALIWMALVALGLVLICLRLALAKSGTWLLNANLAAAVLVLSVSAAADYDRIAAGWNVRHAREVGGRGAPLDLCYLFWMDSSALLPLIELESRPLPPRLRERVVWLRNDIMDDLESSLPHWRFWSWRDARRLAAAREQVAARRLPRFQAPPRQCDGRPFPPPPPMPIETTTPPPPPLTATPAR